MAYGTIICFVGVLKPLLIPVPLCQLLAHFVLLSTMPSLLLLLRRNPALGPRFGYLTLPCFALTFLLYCCICCLLLCHSLSAAHHHPPQDKMHKCNWVQYFVNNVCKYTDNENMDGCTLLLVLPFDLLCLVSSNS